MQNPSGVTSYPVSEKRYTATSIDISTNILTVGNHNLISGESVRVYSDTGIVPDGIVSEDIYYIVRHSATEIKLAKTFNAATAQTPETINIRNTKFYGRQNICVKRNSFF